jgi:hypothetical protein
MLPVYRLVCQGKCPNPHCARPIEAGRGRVGGDEDGWSRWGAWGSSGIWQGGEAACDVSRDACKLAGDGGEWP